MPIKSIAWFRERLALTWKFKQPRINWREWPLGFANDSFEGRPRTPGFYVRMYSLWQGIRLLLDIMHDEEFVAVVRKRTSQKERDELRLALRWLDALWKWREVSVAWAIATVNDTENEIEGSVPATEEESRA